MFAARQLTTALGGRWFGSYGSARCPAHEDQHPSLSIRDGKRSVLVKCHAGCGPEDIIAALRRRGLWSGELKSDRQPTIRKRSAEDTRRYLLSIWRQCGPSGHINLAHMTDVKKAGACAHRKVLLRNAGVFHRHLPTAKLHHARARGLMHGIQRGTLRCDVGLNCQGAFLREKQIRNGNSQPSIIENQRSR